MKHQYNFTVPQRESMVVLILIIAKIARSLLRQFALPAILVYFAGSRKTDALGSFFIYFFLGITLLSTIGSLIAYFRKSYHIDEDELIVDSGLFSKKRVSVPFERIQSINFEQNLIHRLFKVKKIKIDTAGSAEKEIELEGIDADKADVLKALLLAERQEALSMHPIYALPSESHVESSPLSLNTKIFSLSLPNLLKAGLLQNHLKSIGVILIGAWYIYQQAEELGFDTDDYVEEVSWTFVLSKIGILIALLLGASIIISLARMILNNYGLTFARINNGFNIQRGLLNRVSLSAMDHKIQTVGWSDNVIKRWFKIFDIHMRQASNKQVDTKESITIPGASIGHIHQVLQYLYPHEKFDGITLNQVDIRYRNRRMLFSTLFGIAIGLGYGIGISVVGGVILSMLAIVLFILLHIKAYKKLAYGYNDELIRLRGGVFGDSNIITPIYKIQSIEKKQSPYQRKNKLASLVLYNAGGSETIPYIDEATADHIFNLFLKKVENTNKKWY